MTDNNFRGRLAEHLNSRPVHERYGLDVSKPIQGSDIKDVEVTWDEGETSDNEDYGLSPRLPALNVEVELHDGRRIIANPGWCIAALMKSALGDIVEDNNIDQYDEIPKCPYSDHTLELCGAGNAADHGFLNAEDLRFDDSETPDLSTLGGHWDQRDVHWHHAGEYRTRVALGRRIARLPNTVWPNEPEECQAGMTDTTWILDGKVLLCNGCGIDGT